MRRSAVLLLTLLMLAGCTSIRHYRECRAAAQFQRCDDPKGTDTICRDDDCTLRFRLALGP